MPTTRHSFHTPPDTLRLPPWLAERTHALAEPRAGEHVVYWMRTATRGHDNPALDTALEAARALDVPMFVYQGLSERYPYASDRHHTFILQGTRDVQRELAERNIGYLLHVERPGARQGVLRALAERAALVVTEDMPVPPLDGWARTVSQLAPLWLVDTACVVPMRSVGVRCDRAFRFRQQLEATLHERLAQPWPDAARGDGFVPSMDVAGLDASTLDIEALVASCAIDHGVAPVPHTLGGSAAGYARWNAFRDSRLRRYATDRNDPLRDASSRMSAYLHYGMVSPLRLAREAARFDKYLDELVVWRELAYHLCLHRSALGPLESLDSLPGWAVETLLRHAADPRPHRSTWEDLSRGTTHDALWNAAQASLRIHGELHNNVRMTWGKQLLDLTASPQRALEMLIDLNHRYALDGRDPASYGGLLWCLGLFDRPFAPERPIHGTLRHRSSREHAARLDVERYAAQVSRPALVAPHDPQAGSPPLRVAVVGAGISGLACARSLRDHGHAVQLLDKARRPGGRLASRREGFDHGAPGFTVTHPSVGRLVASWVEAGLASPWTPRCARWTKAGLEQAPAQHAWFVGVPTNNALAAHLARDLDVRCETRITRLERLEAGWQLHADTAPIGCFDAVVLALPLEQAHELLLASGLEATLPATPTHACVTAMLTTDSPLPLEADVIAIIEAEPGAPLSAADRGADDGIRSEHPGAELACIIRESSKPGRAHASACTTVHFSAAWSAAQLDSDAETLHRAVTAALEASPALGPWLRSAAPAIKVHRWRYARTSSLLDGLPGLGTAEHACDASARARSDEPQAHENTTGLLTCGDGISGGGVERAYLSGVAAAARVLSLAAARSAAGTRPGPGG